MSRLTEHLAAASRENPLSGPRAELQQLRRDVDMYLNNLALVARDTAIAVVQTGPTGKPSRFDGTDKYELRNQSITCVGFPARVTWLGITDHRPGLLPARRQTKHISYSMHAGLVVKEKTGPIYEHSLGVETNSPWIFQDRWTRDTNDYDRNPYNGNPATLRRDYTQVHMGRFFSGLIVAGLINGMAEAQGVDNRTRITFPDGAGTLLASWHEKGDPAIVEGYMQDLALLVPPQSNDTHVISHLPLQQA